MKKNILPLNIMNGIEAPSMFPQTSAVRRAKKGMADSRAMAEQHERYNPVNPKSQLMTNYTGMGMCGGSATPSMGLSQYRGGGYADGVKAYLDKKMSDKVASVKGKVKDYFTQKRAPQPKRAPQKLKGLGKPSEAHMMGQHLSKHIHDLHGAGFWSEFGDGFKKGFTGSLDAVRDATAFIPGFNQTMDAGRSVVGWGHPEEPTGKKRLGRSQKRGAGFWDEFGQGFKQGFTGSLDAVRDATAFIPGFNQTMDAGRKVVGWGHSEEHRAMEQMGKKRLGRSRNKSDVPLMSGNINGNRGGANTGAYEGHGKLMEGGMLGQDGHGQKKKRMVGAGVLARASVVKKVMADQGLNMIQASKYVKEHNLYQK